jgi:hypothetical protein
VDLIEIQKLSGRSKGVRLILLRLDVYAGAFCVL